MTPKLLLSIFPGIDLFGRAFEAQGYCVLRGPDPLWGGAIEDFTPPADVFEGVIGGSPCQDFSRARRSPPTGNGVRLLRQFLRVVNVARPEWFILENVPGCPDVALEGYTMQRFFANARSSGSLQHRHRRFQFGDRSGALICFERICFPAAPVHRTCMATEGKVKSRRSWGDFCELQGLPRTFVLPGLSREAAYRAVGNGVNLEMGRDIAIAISRRRVTAGRKLCVCECGRLVGNHALHFSPACRKRMERKRRDSAGVSGPGPVTLEESHPGAGARK